MVLVAHQLLYRTQVNSSHDETTGEGVSQTTPGNSRNSRRLDRCFKPLPWFRQLPSVTIEKYRLASIALRVSLLEGRDGSIVEFNVPNSSMLLQGIVINLLSRSMFSQTMLYCSRFSR